MMAGCVDGGVVLVVRIGMEVGYVKEAAKGFAEGGDGVGPG